ncbi:MULTISPECIES: MlaD family protein [Commensalibacter]|uniref:Toluene ABC transporter substrate-binding periplasmic protein n=2 Tax=Commensalibacter TaxID=1079922 RepID=W7E111_9PROT|nr:MULTISPECIES: MlaD family protein [Commensalibacter]EUK18714.1 toluene ABC transporter substrate-binding periplasmic protein [Commensalibacter papalotli (ex Servin-Garciduenas et al. 2014)]CAI3923259.1 Periplasmic subunit MlaD of the ABC-type intermembrane phospholipid transporter Mla (MlaD) (PDB:5UW8) [Commensalibacter papalotli (ex Botero et al. 2024)]CAI3928889.1 Periplasmic subunit MlaD of the ABC-type intermembrane phospholipid transporter Mla (MlaD) (PDB:5UW8) [Commensalibacter papalotl
MKNIKVSAYIASGLVLVVAIGFYSYSRMTMFGIKGDKYPLTAQFYSANTLEPGGSVILSGVPVGVVRSVQLNKKTFMADVKLEINKTIHLPDDSSFSIGSLGMTDSGSIMVHPGKSKEYLKPDSFVTNTQPYTSIEQQISNYIFGGGNLSAK